MTPFQTDSVAAVFEAYPLGIREKLLALRELIFETAEHTPGVGALQETLKWGEPAYLTAQTKSGSTIRIHWKRSSPTQYCMYFICTTNLVDTFRTLFPNDFMFEGNRALVFDEREPVPLDELAFCVAAALTYKLACSRRQT
jgi:hypothetical protein